MPMLLIDFMDDKKTHEFGNSSALKEFLKMQNPTVLNYYKKQAESLFPIKITGSGNNIHIKNIVVTNEKR